jgi:TRAP-type uncharacterized transport system fused permease subunit
MKRQAAVDFIAALVAGALVAYVLLVCREAWGRFGLSGTVVVFGMVALVLLATTALYGCGAFVFFTRAVLEIERAQSGFILRPDTHAKFSPRLVPSVSSVRRVGGFVFFTAGRLLWVVPADRFPLEHAGEV